MFLRTCYLQCCLTEQRKLFMHMCWTVKFLVSFLAIECICVFTIFFFIKTLDWRKSFHDVSKSRTEMFRDVALCVWQKSLIPLCLQLWAATISTTSDRMNKSNTTRVLYIFIYLWRSCLSDYFWPLLFRPSSGRNSLSSKLYSIHNIIYKTLFYKISFCQ
jgi:hypothetical protein